MLDIDCELPQHSRRVSLRLRGVNEPVIAVENGALVAAAPVVQTGDLLLLRDTVQELKNKLWHAGREKSRAVKEAEGQVRLIKETVKVGARDVAHALARATHGLDDARLEIAKVKKSAKYYYSLAYRQERRIKELEAAEAELKLSWKSEQSARLALEGRSRRFEIALEKQAQAKQSAIDDNRKRAAEQVELKREKRAASIREKALNAELEEVCARASASEAAQAQRQEQVQALQRELEEAKAAEAQLRENMPDEEVLVAHHVMGEYLASKNELQAKELAGMKASLDTANQQIVSLCETVAQLKPRKTRDKDEEAAGRTMRRHHKEDVDFLTTTFKERRWDGEDVAQALQNAGPKLFEEVFDSRLVRCIVAI